MSSKTKSASKSSTLSAQVRPVTRKSNGAPAPAPVPAPAAVAAKRQPKAETQAARLAARTALSAIAGTSRTLRPKEEVAAERARRASKRNARLESVLDGLTKGETGQKAKFNVRFALHRACIAVRLGATVAQLQACTALQGAAQWAAFEEPLKQLAQAKRINGATLLVGLGVTGAPQVAPQVASTTAGKRRPKHAEAAE